MSQANGDLSGLTFCGERSYTFSHPDIVTLGSIQTDWNLQVKSSDGYSEGQTIEVTVTVTVQYSISSTRDVVFNVIVPS